MNTLSQAIQGLLIATPKVMDLLSFFQDKDKNNILIKNISALSKYKTSLKNQSDLPNFVLYWTQTTFVTTGLSTEEPINVMVSADKYSEMLQNVMSNFSKSTFIGWHIDAFNELQSILVDTPDDNFMSVDDNDKLRNLYNLRDNTKSKLRALSFPIQDKNYSSKIFRLDISDRVKFAAITEKVTRLQVVVDRLNIIKRGQPALEVSENRFQTLRVVSTWTKDGFEQFYNTMIHDLDQAETEKAAFISNLYQLEKVKHENAVKQVEAKMSELKRVIDQYDSDIIAIENAAKAKKAECLNLMGRLGIVVSKEISDQMKKVVKDEVVKDESDT